jgi:hypothetical protein
LVKLSRSRLRARGASSVAKDEPICRSHRSTRRNGVSGVFWGSLTCDDCGELRRPSSSVSSFPLCWRFVHNTPH